MLEWPQSLVLTYAFASRVRLYLGMGYAMPNQFVLVPMLYLLPAGQRPAAGGGDARRRPRCWTRVLGRAHPERMLTAVADAWHVLGGALVFVLACEPDPTLSSWPWLAAALAAQCAVDLVAASGAGVARPRHPPRRRRARDPHPSTWSTCR